jgi:hypothetical protein
MDHSSGPHPREEFDAGVGMIAAPLLLLAGTILHSAHLRRFASLLGAAAAHRARWYAAQLLFLLALAAFVPAVLGLVHLARSNEPGMALAGGVVALLGLATARAGVLPVWAGLALAVGPAAWLAAVVSSPLAIAAAVCLLAAMGIAGCLVLTDRAGGWERRGPSTAS